MFSFFNFFCCRGDSDETEETTPLKGKSTTKKWNGYEVEDTGSGEIKIKNTNIYVKSQAQKSADCQLAVRDLLTTGKMKIYRGMSAYHPNFKSALQGLVQPLGEGKSSFDTGSASWTAWQWDYDTAVGFAVSVQGMGENDRIEKVSGYDKSNSEFVVGVVLSTEVKRSASLMFYNATEVQVQGLTRATVEKLKMGTSLSSYVALSHYMNESRKTIADIMPDKE